METVAEIKHITKSFGSREILKDIDFRIEKGENLVVFGKSGSGKSVLIKCMAGLLSPDEGEVFMLGEKIQGMKNRELNLLRKRIGFLFQGAALYDSMTVRENLAFPLKRVAKTRDKTEIEQRSQEALEAVGLAEAIDKMPSDLSGGMRKRLGLARTLIVHPELVLYDEPTSRLDTITSREISDLILEMQQKYQASSIIITHDIPCVKTVADRVLVMGNGGFIAEGTFEELENSPDEYVRSFFK